VIVGRQPVHSGSSYALGWAESEVSGRWFLNPDLDACLNLRDTKTRRGIRQAGCCYKNNRTHRLAICIRNSSLDERSNSLPLPDKKSGSSKANSSSFGVQIIIVKKFKLQATCTLRTCALLQTQAVFAVMTSEDGRPVCRFQPTRDEGQV
jgi:hypothetical protein